MYFIRYKMRLNSSVLHGTKPFSCIVQDRDGGNCMVFGSYDWRSTPWGIELDNFEFFPYDNDLEDSVYDWISDDIKGL